MAEPSRKVPSPQALALGRVPSGLFILTVRLREQSTGMLVSWVQQCGFDPLTLTVAVGRDRFTTDWIAETGKFTLNQLRAGQKPLLRHFARGFPPGVPAFEGLGLLDEAEGGPVLSDALSFLDLQVVGQIDGGDHRIFLAGVTAGRLLGGSSNAEPMLHVRHSAIHY